MSFAFKKFNFFHQQEAQAHSYPRNATCCTQSIGYMFVGCDNGSVQALDEAIRPAFSFSAHGYKVFEIMWLEGKSLLLTVGSEEPGYSSATLKLWEGSKLTPSAGVQSGSGSSSGSGAPAAGNGAVSLVGLTPLKVAKVFGPKFVEAEITVLAARETTGGGLTIAVGLASGMVYIFTCDLSAKGRLQHSTKLNARPEQGELWSVTGLHFQGEAELLSLFVVTESQTLSYNLLTAAKTILDQQGAASLHCCVQRNGLLVVAREEGLYDYTLDTRAGCTVFEGRKQQLAVLRRFLVVVTRESNDMGVSSSTIHITDVRNKMVAGTFSLQNVLRVVPAWGSLLVITGAGKVFTLQEVDLAVQLDTLFKRSMHKLALDIARAQNADQATIANIQQRWGDHLYAKGEFDAAMSQYLETISFLEPSYVIRRFLDAQRIHNLTCYLEQLHERGLASADHTTLLLNCYTKLKDVDKLDAFIHKDEGAADAGGSDAEGHRAQPAAALKFDVETAVKVLRAAGYYSHALWVAEAAQQPDWILSILLDDCGSYSEALAFLDTLGRKQCAEALRKYGKVLISYRPEDTTRLLMELCIPGHDLDGSTYTASVADFAHLYSDRPTALMLLCEFILNTRQTTSPPHERLLYHTLLELYLAERLPDEPAHEADNDASQHALLQQTRRAKALELLQSGWPAHLSAEEAKYDADHVLVLCRLQHFREGLVFLYDKLRLYREVLQVHMAAQDHAGLIAATIKYGDAARGGDPQLWAEVLEYFVMQAGDLTEQVTEVVERIEAGKILPPLVVLQTLAKNNSLKVSSVRGYVARQLARETLDISKDREQIAKLTAETAAMRTEVHKLRTQPRAFQNTKCAATDQPLELPVVHFLCGHSYNLRSLGENDKECPICAPDFRRVLEIRRNMAAAAMQQDRFFTELRENSDGFSVVAEHFGRGLMNMTAHATGAAAPASS